jgi:predicted alpha/beta-hydrolase family hydrolase
MPDFLKRGPTAATATLLLAHGAGTAMDSDWMTGVAESLAARGIAVARFEFAYMAGRRGGQRKPPPRAETLLGEYRAAIAGLKAKGPLFIGGKSMGGRIASMVADEGFAARKIAGLVYLGYPFHPPGQPDKLRTGHLEALRTPALFCQGVRDPFGSRDEVGTYRLAGSIEMEWLTDGDHDFRPRKAVSGLTLADNIATATDKVAAWIEARR